MAITPSASQADLVYNIAQTAVSVTLPTFSYTPLTCTGPLTEQISYPTFVVDPSTVFTYDTATRLFKVETSNYGAKGSYVVNLKAINP